MDFGLFMMPLHPPRRSFADAYDRDIDLIVQADRLGYHEAWIGEHITEMWENAPVPELLIAKALALTERIIFATGVTMLPLHHPVDTAHRIAMLDHMARGRFYWGIGVRSLPTDLQLYGIEYRKNTATFRAVPPARWCPPPATLRPLGPTPTTPDQTQRPASAGPGLWVGERNVSWLFSFPINVIHHSDRLSDSHGARREHVRYLRVCTGKADWRNVVTTRADNPGAAGLDRRRPGHIPPCYPPSMRHRRSADGVALGTCCPALWST